MLLRLGPQEAFERRRDFGREDVALLDAHARGADALREPLLPVLDLGGAPGLLERRRRIIGFLTQLVVLLVAYLEVPRTCPSGPRASFRCARTVEAERTSANITRVVEVFIALLFSRNISETM